MVTEWLGENMEELIYVPIEGTIAVPEDLIIVPNYMVLLWNKLKTTLW